MLNETQNQQFKELYSAGMEAKNIRQHAGALTYFEAADDYALAHDDSQKRLDALQPAARALWSLGRYDEASTKLGIAADIAQDLGLEDERGIITSNMGRLAVVKTLASVPIDMQAQVLKSEALPFFQQATNVLRGNPHLYFRYANAQHGSVAAALANQRRTTAQLVGEGIKVAFRKSPKPYDQKRTYELNPRGLLQLLAATALIPFGTKTPLVAKFVRNNLIS